MLRVLEYAWCICEKHKERQRESKRLYLGDSEKINTQVDNFIYPHRLLRTQTKRPRALIIYARNKIITL